MNKKYPNLLSPARIGKVELSNKTVMAAMGMSQSDNGFVNQAVLNHYAAGARGGVCRSVKADTVVLAVGDKPDTVLYDELKDKVAEIYNIGVSNSGGSRNGPSIIVSSVLCAVFIIAMSIRTEKKKV